MERQQDELRSAISVYDTTDFSLVRQILFGRELMLNHIEFDTITGAYYVLGFMRDEAGIMDHGFVSTLEDLQLANITPITENEYDFYCAYKDLELHGFSTKSYEWSTLDCPLDQLKSLNHSLAKLYAYYHK